MTNLGEINPFYLTDVKTVQQVMRGYGIENLENTIRFYGDKMPMAVKIEITNELAHRGSSGYCSKYIPNQY